MASQYFNSRKRKEREARNELSDREKFADEIHIILKSLKREILITKELHKTWRDDATMHSVEQDYKIHAGLVVEKAEALGKGLRLPSVRSTQELETQLYRHDTLKKGHEHAIMNLQKEWETLNVDVKGLTRSLDTEEKKVRSLKHELLSNSEILNDKEEEIMDLLEKLDRLNERCENAEIALDKSKDNEIKWWTEMRQQQQILEDKENEIMKIREEAITPRDLLKEEENGIYEKIVDNDLADPNRPMKFAETMLALYDNEWSTAMDELEGIDDQQSTEMLLNIFIESYHMCKEINEKHTESILSGHSILFPDIDGLRDLASHEQTERLNNEFEKYVRNYRKVHCDAAGEYISQVITKKYEIKSDLDEAKKKACKIFMKECTKFNWRISLQDPPLHIEWNFRHGDEYDRSKLKSYTRGGNFVDFVVWPVLYQYNGGPLLSKGIAQGMTRTEL